MHGDRVETMKDSVCMHMLCCVLGGGSEVVHKCFYFKLSLIIQTFVSWKTPQEPSGSTSHHGMTSLLDLASS